MYTFDFLLNFNDKNITFEEIKYIKQKGIGQYLFEMGIEFSKTLESYDLIDNNLNNIGYFINYKTKSEKNLFYFRDCSKNFVNFENAKFYRVVLLCLCNLDELMKFFLFKNELKNIMDKDSIYTKHFAEIANDLWSIDDKETNVNLFVNLMKEIQKTNKNNIFQNIKLLIEFLILNLHNEQKIDNSEKNLTKQTDLSEIYGSYDEIQQNFYLYNDSNIGNLFFFDLEIKYHCKSCGQTYYQYSVECTLEINLEEVKKKNLEAISIYNILDCLKKEDNSICECNQTLEKNISFIKPPKFLIIIIKKEEDENIKFLLEKSININIYSYMSKSISLYGIKKSYELVSFIQNKLNFFCKSKNGNDFFKLEGKNINKKLNFNNSNKSNYKINVPYLLVYKKKE